MKKEIRCNLQQTCYTLQSQAATRNGLKEVSATTANSRTQFYIVQSLQAQKDVTQVAEKRCYRQETTWNLSGNAVATQIARRIV